jgi:hypothetical protein
MDLDLRHLATFFVIALASGLIWQASLKSYVFAVVGAAITGTVLAYGAAYVVFGPVLGRAPHWSLVVVSLPLCGAVAAVSGIPFTLHTVVEKASAALMVLTALVFYGLIKLAESWGNVFDFNVEAVLVAIGCFTTVLAVGMLFGFGPKSPPE